MIDIKDANYVTIKNTSSGHIIVETQSIETVVNQNQRIMILVGNEITFDKKIIADWDNIMWHQSEGLMEVIGSIDYPGGDTVLVVVEDKAPTSRFELMEI